MYLKIINLMLLIFLSTLATSTIFSSTNDIYALRGFLFGHHFFGNHPFFHHILPNHRPVPLHHTIINHVIPNHRPVSLHHTIINHVIPNHRPVSLHHTIINHVIPNHRPVPLHHTIKRNPSTNPNLPSNKINAPATVHIFMGPQVLY